MIRELRRLDVNKTHIIYKLLIQINVTSCLSADTQIFIDLNSNLYIYKCMSSKWRGSTKLKSPFPQKIVITCINMFQSIQFKLIFKFINYFIYYLLHIILLKQLNNLLQFFTIMFEFKIALNIYYKNIKSLLQIVML